MPGKQPRRPWTTARWRALRWLADHERDVSAVMHRKKPSRRMLTLMVRDEQITWLPTSIHYLHKAVLSEKGRQLLASWHKHINGHEQPAKCLATLRRGNKSPTRQADTDQGSQASTLSTQSPR